MPLFVRSFPGLETFSPQAHAGLEQSGNLENPNKVALYIYPGAQTLCIPMYGPVSFGMSDLGWEWVEAEPESGSLFK